MCLLKKKTNFFDHYSVIISRRCVIELELRIITLIGTYRALHGDVFLLELFGTHKDNCLKAGAYSVVNNTYHHKMANVRRHACMNVIRVTFVSSLFQIYLTLDKLFDDRFGEVAKTRNVPGWWKQPPNIVYKYCMKYRFRCGCLFV